LAVSKIWYPSSVVMAKAISYPGHIEKAKAQINRNLKAVDVVFELIDSRIPYSGRAYEWKSLFSNKETVIVLTKRDLADPSVTDQWIHYYRNKGKMALPISLLGKPKQIVADLKKIRDSIPTKRAIRKAMIVGIPNVGKTSLVNAIKKGGKAAVGNFPGITRGIQWMIVDDDFMVLDTPGILYKDLHAPHITKKLILCGCVRPAHGWLEESIEYGIQTIANLYPGEMKATMLTWELATKNERSFIEQSALEKGFLSKKGMPDVQRALDYWLKQFSEGGMGRFSLETPKRLFADPQNESEPTLGDV